jgi:hypothetical protein
MREFIQLNSSNWTLNPFQADIMTCPPWVIHVIGALWLFPLMWYSQPESIFLWL